MEIPGKRGNSKATYQRKVVNGREYLIFRLNGKVTYSSIEYPVKTNDNNNKSTNN